MKQAFTHLCALIALVAVSSLNTRLFGQCNIITTVAGTGTSGSTGDGGAATAAKLSNPNGVFVDPSGNVIIADYTNKRVRIE